MTSAWILLVALMASVSFRSVDGSAYVRWGRTSCHGGASLVYKGYAAGAHFNIDGSGSNMLCVHEQPQFRNTMEGDQTGGLLSGVQYEMYNSGIHHNNVFDESNTGGAGLETRPVPCAVCSLSGITYTLMIPARTECPAGFSEEYGGYLVSDYSGLARSSKRNSYLCFDKAPEVAAGGVDQEHAVVYPVEFKCGTLPCDPYVDGKEVACIVCSKREH